MNIEQGVWTDALSVGVPVLDADHQRLFQLISEVQKAVNPFNPDGVESAIQSLVSYTVFHFEREEGYLAKAHYPALLAHRKLHLFLTRRVMELQAEFKAGRESPLAAERLAEMLNDWLVLHIQTEDQRYTPYLEDLVPLED